MVSNNYQEYLQLFRLLLFPILPGTSNNRAYTVWRQNTRKELRRGVIFVEVKKNKPRVPYLSR
jgi:hypothetical protein